MKKIEAYQCEHCDKIFERESKQHEEICKWTKGGHAVWIEEGEVKHSLPIPGDTFGEHKYKDQGTSDCAYGCGCWAGPTSSGGPVDPFGCCPNNKIENPRKII